MSRILAASAMSRLGHSAGVVAEQPDVDGRVGQGDVGMVVGLLGRLAYAVDEGQPGREVPGGVERLDRSEQDLPALRLLLEGLGAGEGLGHGVLLRLPVHGIGPQGRTDCPMGPGL